MFSRNSKPKNRPSFQQVLLHVEIAAGDVLKTPREIYLNQQVTNSMIFCSHAYKTHFHEKGFALSPVLKVKVFGTRKWFIISFLKITWRGEIKEEFEKMKNRSSAHMQNLHQLHQLDEELIRRRKEELR